MFGLGTTDIEVDEILHILEVGMVEVFVMKDFLVAQGAFGLDVYFVTDCGASDGAGEYNLL